MKHQKRGRKFGRKKDQRRALFKSLLNNIVKYEKFETTEAKAKVLKSKIEKLVTCAKNNTINNRKILARTLKKNMVKKIIEEIAPRYKKRRGGYVRVVKSGRRKHDASSMAIIEFVESS